MAAMIGGQRTRGKLSTLSVDNLAEKFSGASKFPCFRRVSLICLFFRHFVNPLKPNERISTIWQIPDKSEDFVKVL
jgi:hypothetical protein